MKLRSGKTSRLLCVNNAWFIHFSVACVMQAMSATRADTYTGQRIEEHKGSAIGNHLREQHDIEPEDIAQSFPILRKCQNKCDCLIFEMLFLSKN